MRPSEVRVRGTDAAMELIWMALDFIWLVLGIFVQLLILLRNELRFMEILDEALGPELENSTVGASKIPRVEH